MIHYGAPIQIVPPPSSFSLPLVSNFDPSILRSNPRKNTRRERGEKGGWWYVHRGKRIYFPAFGSEIEWGGKGRRGGNGGRHQGSYFSPCSPLVDRWQIGAANFTRPPRKFRASWVSRIRVEFTLNISYRLIRRRDDPRNPSFGFEYIRDNLKRRREKRITRIKSLS